MLRFYFITVFFGCSLIAMAQDSTHKHLPIIDVHVYIDVAGMIWSYPLAEMNDYVKRLVQAGFEKRIMYGRDLMIWPKLLETSLGVIENANYLSYDQKRDILFNNAVCFFRLDPNKFNK